MNKQVEQIKVEVERRINNISKMSGGVIITTSVEVEYKLLNELLDFINSLSEEPISEDLEKEAEKYADRITAELYRRSDKRYDKEKKCMASVLYNVNWSEIGKEMEKCFIEGAKWDVQTMIERTCKWLEGIAELTGCDSYALIETYKKSMKGE